MVTTLERETEYTTPQLAEGGRLCPCGRPLKSFLLKCEDCTDATAAEARRGRVPERRCAICRASIEGTDWRRKVCPTRTCENAQARRFMAARRAEARGKRPPSRCATCGRKFGPRDPRKLACSPACEKLRRAEYQRSRLPAESTRSRTCRCGRLFVPWRADRRIRFCSARCHRDGLNERRRERYQSAKPAQRCGWCGEEFKPRNAKRKCHEGACTRLHKNAAQGQRDAAGKASRSRKRAFLAAVRQMFPEAFQKPRPVKAGRGPDKAVGVAGRPP